jgi:hypothetical protein
MGSSVGVEFQLFPAAAVPPKAAVTHPLCQDNEDEPEVKEEHEDKGEDDHHKASERVKIELVELHAILRPAARSSDFVPLVVLPEVEEDEDEEENAEELEPEPEPELEPGAVPTCNKFPSANAAALMGSSVGVEFQLFPAAGVPTKAAVTCSLCRGNEDEAKSKRNTKTKVKVITTKQVKESKWSWLNCMPSCVLQLVEQEATTFGGLF